MAQPAPLAPAEGASVVDRIQNSLSRTWNEGGSELYLPFHAHHLRYAYTNKQIDSYREDSWGLGYGRSRYDDAGNWHGLFAMGFLDSHSKIEPFAGYGYQWIWGEHQGLHAGLGYTIFVTARSDVGHYMPLPGVLPIASVGYGHVAINSAFLPGGQGNGNILFFWGRAGF